MHSEFTDNLPTTADLVIVVVFDGLRPDMVTPQTMPHLLQWLESGCWFRESTSIFPTMTRVAAASLASGAYPESHGVISNQFFQPNIFSDLPFDTSKFEMIRQAENHYNGKLVTASSLGEILADNQLHLAAAHCGSAGAAYMLNHKVRENGHWTFSIHGRNKTATPDAVDATIEACGPVPSLDNPRRKVSTYITDVFLTQALEQQKPDVAILWYPEPDTSFHFHGIGSAESEQILHHLDRQFSRVVDWVESQPNADRIGMLVLSDHGQITMTQQVDLAALMTAAGFPTSSMPGPETIFSLTNGRTCEIRLRNHDHSLTGHLAAFLMERPEVGMLFGNSKAVGECFPAGILDMDLILAGHERAPDLYVILRDSIERKADGISGCGFFTGGVEVGCGMHGGLNRHELNNVLMIKGPGVVEGSTMYCPAGITDVAPTILSWLGVTPEVLPGRLLDEAFGAPAIPAVATHFDKSFNGFQQRLSIITYRGRSYIKEGFRIA